MRFRWMMKKKLHLFMAVPVLLIIDRMRHPSLPADFDNQGPHSGSKERQRRNLAAAGQPREGPLSRRRPYRPLCRIRIELPRCKLP